MALAGYECQFLLVLLQACSALSLSCLHLFVSQYQAYYDWPWPSVLSKTTRFPFWHYRQKSQYGGNFLMCFGLRANSLYFYAMAWDCFRLISWFMGQPPIHLLSVGPSACKGVNTSNLWTMNTFSWQTYYFSTMMKESVTIFLYLCYIATDSGMTKVLSCIHGAALSQF